MALIFVCYSTVFKLIKRQQGRGRKSNPQAFDYTLVSTTLYVLHYYLIYIIIGKLRKSLPLMHSINKKTSWFSSSAPKNVRMLRFNPVLSSLHKFISFSSNSFHFHQTHFFSWSILKIKRIQQHRWLFKIISKHLYI